MEQNKNVFNWQWHQTMLRVKDHERSVAFYTKYFDLVLIDTYDFPQWKFQLYFLASLPKGTNKDSLPTPGTKEAHDNLWKFKGSTLELTYNYGTEKDADFKYHPGNTTISEKQKDGFGHISFHCDSAAELCQTLEKDGIQIKKTETGINYINDYDGYEVRIIERGDKTKSELQSTITLGQCNLRVKDPKKSVHFYTHFCHMTQVAEKHHNTYSEYFLATLPVDFKVPADLKSEEANNLRSSLFEQILVLTHIHGTENVEDFTYLSGNTEPYKGFGHTGFLVDDVYAACEVLEKAEVPFQKTVNGGSMKGLAFAKDPDGYWVEIIKRGWADL